MEGWVRQSIWVSNRGRAREAVATGISRVTNNAVKYVS